MVDGIEDDVEDVRVDGGVASGRRRTVVVDVLRGRVVVVVERGTVVVVVVAVVVVVVRGLVVVVVAITTGTGCVAALDGTVRTSRYSTPRPMNNTSSSAVESAYAEPCVDRLLHRLPGGRELHRAGAGSAMGATICGAQAHARSAVAARG